MTFSAAGSTTASVQGAVDAFRAALGTLNSNVAGSFGSGRREINWDGVPNAFAAPNALPGDFFNVNSPRGVVLSTPGSALQVSANAGLATPAEFGNIDASFPGLFAPFSAQRLFTAVGSNIVDVGFFVPGSTTAALTRGFGVVFSDVDIAGTLLEFFDADNLSLGRFDATPVAGRDESFSFLGVLFSEGSVVSRVRITSGTQALMPGATAGDLVVMDDFIYAEPVAARLRVPEPMTAALSALALAALMLQRRRRR